MEIKFKKLHKDAKTPTQGRVGDAAWDLTAAYISESSQGIVQYIEYSTGIAIKIPEDHVGLVFPRSSVSKQNQILSNSVGVIDSNYRGEIKLRFKKDGPHLINAYKEGDKIGQLIIIPRPFLEFTQVEELDETNRGSQGFGSSGK